MPMETDASQPLRSLEKDAKLADLGVNKTAVLFGASWDDASVQLKSLLAESAAKAAYPTVRGCFPARVAEGSL